MLEICFSTLGIIPESGVLRLQLTGLDLSPLVFERDAVRKNAYPAPQFTYLFYSYHRANILNISQLY